MPLSSDDTKCDFYCWHHYRSNNEQESGNKLAQRIVSMTAQTKEHPWTIERPKKMT